MLKILTPMANILFGNSYKIELSAIPKVSTKRSLDYTPVSQYQGRKDIKSWKDALNMAGNADEPNSSFLVDVYKSIELDTLLTSQIEIRTKSALSSTFTIQTNKKTDEQTTNLLVDALWVEAINKSILRSKYYGYSLVELSFKDGQLAVSQISDYNIEPTKGWFFKDSTQREKNNAIEYRKLKEFGTTILEFGTEYRDGLLNKATPQAIFKKFAQSCYSEYCERFGMPVMVLKTETQDPIMLSNAIKMMNVIGSSGVAVIDKAESFEFAQTITSSGEVYNNFISLCNSEMSMLIAGAVIGQDTKNGSYNKDENSSKVLANLVDSDLVFLEQIWASKIIPTLVKLGVMKQGQRLVYDKTENLKELWGITNDCLQRGLEVDTEWIKNKFGVEVKGYLK
jgi:phage gp29-like protein